MKYSQNFIFLVTVLGPKDANCPTVAVGEFYEKMYVLRALLHPIMHWDDTWGKAYKESTVKIV